MSELTLAGNPCRFTIKKNSRETLIIELAKYKDHDLLNLRVWADDKGKLVPTSKGVSLKVGLLPEILDALTKAKAEAVRLGLIGGVR